MGALTMILLNPGELLRRCRPGLKQGPGDRTSCLGDLPLLMVGQEGRKQGFVGLA